MTMRPLIHALSLSLLFALASAHAGYRTACEQALGANDYRLLSNQFTVNRTADQYAWALGARFIHDLRSLGLDSHWLDAGTGQAVAMDNFATGVNTDFGWVQVRSRGLTALAVRKAPSNSIQRLQTAPGRQFRYLEGKYLEDYSIQDVGECDFITDVLGPFSYTARIDLVLRKYLEFLKIGGVAYISFVPQILTINNQWYGLDTYLRNIRGVRVEWMGSQAIRLEKVAWTNWWDVPELRLESFRTQLGSALPLRWYWY